eukprot:5777383-Prymnesium_polylepis.1
MACPGEPAPTCAVATHGRLARRPRRPSEACDAGRDFGWLLLQDGRQRGTGPRSARRALAHPPQPCALT